MQSKPNIRDKTGLGKLNNENLFLVLHNDDINTFEFVIDSLVDVCRHKVEQAEQCAYITHYKGKCEIKKGTFDILSPMKERLIEKGLSVTID